MLFSVPYRRNQSDPLIRDMLIAARQLTETLLFDADETWHADNIPRGDLL